MAVISRSYVDALTRSLNTLSEATQAVVRAQLAAIEYIDIADLRNQVIAILEPLLSTATDMAAGYAAQTYDSIREASVGSAANAIARSGRIPEATERAIRAMVAEVDKSGYEAFTRSVEARCDYEIKKAAGESTLYNAERDPRKPKWARVPTGAETCTFCLMLASRGFVYRSKESAGALNHWHPHCDCRIVPGFEGVEIEGYDPDELYRQWRETEENKDRAKNKELPDVQIGRSLSSAAFRDDVKIPKSLTGLDHDVHVQVAAGSKIRHVTVIAGKGSSTKIHSELDSLQEQFPDIPRNEWEKCAGNAVVEDMGIERRCHVHWYQVTNDDGSVMRVRMRVIKWLP